MAVLLNRRGNIKAGQNKKNIANRNRKITMKTHPKVRQHLKEVKESIEKAKHPEKVVKIKTLRNLPKNATPTTREFLKSEPKNRNPETNRERNWTYQKYPPILPPPVFIRKTYRAPKAALVGNMKERKVVE